MKILNSTEQNKIFIHIPKNSGTSVRTILHENYNYPNIFEGHFTVQQSVARARLNKYKYKDIFTVVRNPYSRLVSIYFFLKKKMSEHVHILRNEDLTLPFKILTFNQFVKFFLLEVDMRFLWMNYYMFFPQNSWIDKFKNKVIVFKQEEKEKIEKYLKYKLPHENVNTIKLKYSSLYNDELKKIVYTFFEEDFENFKYSKKY